MSSTTQHEPGVRLQHLFEGVVEGGLELDGVAVTGRPASSRLAGPAARSALLSQRAGRWCSSSTRSQRSIGCVEHGEPPRPQIVLGPTTGNVVEMSMSRTRSKLSPLSVEPDPMKSSTKSSTG